MTKNRRRAYAALLINVLIWGAALPVVKPALSHITAFDFLFFRYLIASPLMLPWLFAGLSKKMARRITTIIKIAALEIFGSAIPLSLLYLGLELTSSIDASLLGATTPLFITLASIFILKEKEEKREWIGLTVALTGTMIIAIEPLLSGYKTTSSIPGNLLIISYNILTTFYLITAKRFYRNIPKTLVTSISCLVSLVFFAIIGLLFTGLPSVSALQINEVSLAVFYMGILGTPLAFTLYMYGQNLIEASEASLFSYLTGPVAIPAAMLLVGEIPTSLQILATAIIFTGVFIAEIRPRSRSQTRLKTL